MPRRIADPSGAVWEVMPSGRRTQYGADEVSLEFRRVDNAGVEPRFIRYSPQGAKSVEIALEDASDAALLNLLSTSQPAWTSPDGGYGRAT
jgi:hypothetical protein